MGLDPQLWLSLLERGNAQCEWEYLDGSRCQNAYSLKAHHRTYDRSGTEELADLSLLCPAHHVIADMERKVWIGQRVDIIAQRIVHILKSKRDWLNDSQWRKFFGRWQREDARAYDELQRGREAHQWLSSRLSESGGVIYFEAHHEQQLRVALWFLRQTNRFVAHPEIERVMRWVNRVEDALNNGSSNQYLVR